MFYLSINISAACCQDRALLVECQRLLSEFQNGEIQLILEITERETLVTDIKTTHLFEELNKIGVKVAIDDFGTGYSSLAYLQHFSVDTLKIDQSFIKRIGTEPLSQHIVDNLVDLGARLGISLVAEGVETLKQAEYLQSKGVGLLQGYYFGRPVSVRDFFSKHYHL